MKLYKIRNWNVQFENNRSRAVADLTWVAIPNRHDGENFSGIMAHKDGAIIFAAWVLVIQVASRCQPRGTLLRDNKTPHNPDTLALKTRAPRKWFEVALDYLEKTTDWLDVEDVAGGCQAGDGQVAGGCQAGDEGGNGIEGEEKKGMEPASPSASQEDFFAECRVNPAYTGIDVDREWHKMSAWCLANRQKPSRRRFVNWLNRADKPLTPYRNPNVPPGYSGASCL